MCQFFSCIITKPKKVFYSEVSHSHEDIINENNLNDSANGKLRELFCRVEILPPNGDVFADFKAWKLMVDEREKPLWFTDKHEEACLSAAKKYIDKHVLISQELQEIKDGRYYIKDTKIGSMHGSSAIESMYGSSIIGSMHDSSTVRYMANSSTVRYMHDSSTVRYMHDSSNIEYMHDSSNIEYMHDSSTVRYMYGSSTVMSMANSSTIGSMHGSSTVRYMHDSIVAIDRVNGIIYNTKTRPFK